ncbi:hypothetical protein U6A24_12910 [Aquimarina gracilis]|uniref:Flagellar protein FlbD n=1 Tax=Aquimarina gracilis TaxID=874422 RepID=A0ABU5ZWW6_9FLAO|nr:hypothetical protein [Aquimarina gracilis]MEB3346370.1 hypothetical protein [Aquimarina gracilis]
MEFMEIIDSNGQLHFVNPGHISALTEVDGHCKINVMGQEYMLAKGNMTEVRQKLTSFKHSIY